MQVGQAKKCDTRPISDFIACCERCMRPPSVIPTAAPDRGKLVKLIADKQRRLLMAEDDGKVFMTISLNVTPNTTKQNLIVYVLSE